MNSHLTTEKVLSEIIEQCGEIGPEHEPLVKLSRQLECALRGMIEAMASGSYKESQRSLCNALSALGLAPEKTTHVIGEDEEETE